MKKSTLLLLALFSLGSLYGSNKIGETKTARHTVTVSQSDVINIQAKNTFVNIQTWDKNEVEIVVELTFDGNENDRIRKFLDEFDKNVKDHISKSGGELLIDTNLEEPNKVQIGSKYAGVIVGYSDKELRIEYSIKLPSSNKLKVKSSYKDLIMNGTYQDVEVSQYSADLTGGVFKKATLGLKYGDTNIEFVGEGIIESYENDTEIKEAETLDINDKYSNIFINRIASLAIIGYETDLKIGNTESLNGNLKYGNMTVKEKVSKASLTLYEYDITGEAFGNLRLENSKYSKITLDRANEIRFLESYEDELKIRYLNTLVTKSKYGDYSIEQLGKKLELVGYEDDVNVSELLKTTESISLDGKYLKLNLGTSGISYSLNAAVQYGKIDYNEGNVNVRKYIKENDKLTIEADAKTTSGNVVSVKLTGYEVKAEIN